MFNQTREYGARLLALATMTVAGAPAVQADVPIQWQARFSSYKGDTRCNYGSESCNRCANNVASKFSAFKNAGGNDFEYTYSRDSSYPPANKSPRSFLTTWLSGGRHVQTFTRLAVEDADGRAWFAANYGSLPSSSNGSSAPDESTMYLVNAPTASTGAVNGNGRLAHTYSTWDVHPGGSQGLGKYLLIAHDEGAVERGGYLEVYNLTDKQQGTRVRISTLNDGRAAAVGAAKLAGGGTLVVVKRAGSDNFWFDLHYANSVVGGLPGWEYITSVQGVQQVENVSLITECGTGDIYVLTGQGSDSGLGTNYWKLYRLQQTSSGAALHLVDSANKNQDPDCDARAAATAYVSKDGNLAFYCAQKLALDNVLAGLCAAGVPGTCEAAHATIDDSMTFRQYW